jgi:hypothetical protein
MQTVTTEPGAQLEAEYWAWMEEASAHEEKKYKNAMNLVLL